MPDHHDRREWAENHWRKIAKDLASVSTGQILVAIILCLCSFMAVSYTHLTLPTIPLV